MPAFLTHYAFGTEGLHQMESGTVKSAVRSHRHVYHMGLAGPDLFFYSASYLFGSEMTIGRIMHKYRTGAFLRELYMRSTALEGRDRDIALAYFTGFLGHYCLDSKAHAFVYRVCDTPDPSISLGRHFRYEAAMDGFCCQYVLGRDIRDSHQMGLIRLSGHERRVIAKLLAGAIARVYADAGDVPGQLRLRLNLAEYYLISGLLIDPSGFKEWVFLGVEKLLRGYPLLSPLFINHNKYGLTESDWKRFHIRYERGQVFFHELLGLLEESMHGCAGERQAFFDAAGSWSYHGFFHGDAASSLSLKELCAFQMYRPGSLKQVWKRMDSRAEKR